MSALTGGSGDSFHAEEEPHAGSRFGLSCRTVNTHWAIAAATSVTEEFEVSIIGIIEQPVGELPVLFDKRIVR